MAKHFLDSISLRIFNMADMRWVMCLYKWPWTFHLYEWKLLRAINGNSDPVLVLVLVSMWTQP